MGGSGHLNTFAGRMLLERKTMLVTSISLLSRCFRKPSFLRIFSRSQVAKDLAVSELQELTDHKSNVTQSHRFFFERTEDIDGREKVIFKPPLNECFRGYAGISLSVCPFSVCLCVCLPLRGRHCEVRVSVHLVSMGCIPSIW